MTKGERISYEIFKEVSRDSFEEWLEDRGINYEDWDVFIKAGESALPEQERE